MSGNSHSASVWCRSGTSYLKTLWMLRLWISSRTDWISSGEDVGIKIKKRGLTSPSSDTYKYKNRGKFYFANLTDRGPIVYGPGATLVPLTVQSAAWWKKVGKFEPSILHGGMKQGRSWQCGWVRGPPDRQRLSQLECRHSPTIKTEFRAIFSSEFSLEPRRDQNCLSRKLRT